PASSYPPPTQLPLLPPVPVSDDDEEPSTVEHLLEKVAQPALKVAGSRRSDPKLKGKSKSSTIPHTASEAALGPKQKALPTLSAQPEPKRQHGWAAGTANYSTDDVDNLLDAVEAVLPLGGLAWIEVAQIFSTRSIPLGHPERSAKLLELKFKQATLIFGNVTIHLQVHVMEQAPYRVLLGRPFDVITKSRITNSTEGHQFISITDPNTGEHTSLLTYPRGCLPHTQQNNKPHISEVLPTSVQELNNEEIQTLYLLKSFKGQDIPEKRTLFELQKQLEEKSPVGQRSCWGWCKYCYRQAPKKTFKDAKKAACEAFDSCPTDVICRFINRSWRFMSAYHQGLTGKAAEWAVHKQKGHWAVSHSAMMHIKAIVS
ncbi:hypothetical protein AN958_07392, partial [Leucoagaricus sp. SymC.cos]